MVVEIRKFVWRKLTSRRKDTIPYTSYLVLLVGSICERRIRIFTSLAELPSLRPEKGRLTQQTSLPLFRPFHPSTYAPPPSPASHTQAYPHGGLPADGATISSRPAQQTPRHFPSSIAYLAFPIGTWHNISVRPESKSTPRSEPAPLHWASPTPARSSRLLNSSRGRLLMRC